MESSARPAADGTGRRRSPARRTPHARLKAIVALDIRGFTGLVEHHRDTVIRLLPRYRGMIGQYADRHGGTVFGVAGDGFLVEFDSVEEAVLFALTFQKSVGRQEARRDPEVAFRIGIALGEVVAVGEARYGTAVNVAARAQALAEPGGVCVTEPVFDAIANRLPLAFDDLGPTSLKNVPGTLRLYRIRPDRPSPGRTRHPDPPSRPSDRPRLAIMPIEPVVNDPRSHAFAECLSQDLVTQLSRHHWLGVASPLLSEAHRGRNVEPRVVGSELGVRYLLRGTIRAESAGPFLWLELVSAETGESLWSDRWACSFDGADLDVLAIAAALDRNLQIAEGRRGRARPPEARSALDHYLEGVRRRAMATAEGNRRAIESFRRTLALDPEFGPALAHLASSILAVRDQGWGSLTTEEAEGALQMSRGAIDPDDNDPIALEISAHTLAGLGGEIDEGLARVGRALRLAPSLADAWARSSMVHIYAGDLATAEHHAETALRINPNDETFYLPLCALGYAYLFSGRHREAAQAARRVLAGLRRPPMAYVILASASHYLKDAGAAERAAKSLIKVAPNFDAESWIERSCFVMPQQRHQLQSALSPIVKHISS